VAAVGARALRSGLSSSTDRGTTSASRSPMGDLDPGPALSVARPRPPERYPKGPEYPSGT
jgi:hypothetical protein